MKLCIITGIISLFFISKLVYSQHLDKDNSGNAHYISLYPELLGNGGGVSMSLEYLYLFSQRSMGAYARIGKGVGMDTSLTLGEVGFLFGKNSKYLDTGFGYSVLDNTQFTEYLYVFRIGYRKQFEKGMLLRIAPLFMIKVESDEYAESTSQDSMFWAGFSIGYSFQLNGKAK